MEPASIASGSGDLIISSRTGTSVESFEETIGEFDCLIQAHIEYACRNDTVIERFRSET